MNIFQRKKNIFIITHGRSGSTLLQTILNSIKGYSINGENNNSLFYLFQSVQAIKNAQSFYCHYDVVNGPWKGIKSIDCDRYAKSLCDTFVKSVLKSSRFSKAVGFKEIRYFDESPVESFFDYLNFINNHFSNVYFIFNLRDIRDVVKSGWFQDSPLEESEKYLANSIELIKKANQIFINSHIVYYDEYIHNAENLKSLFDFLDEDFNNVTVSNINRILSIKLSH